MIGIATKTIRRVKEKEREMFVYDDCVNNVCGGLGFYSLSTCFPCRCFF